ADLYYRIDVVEVHLPPLRERVADIPELARHFLAKLGRAGESIDPRVLRRLVAFGWPGNVRELANELERAAVLAGRGRIGERHLSTRRRRRARPPAPSPTGPPAARLATAERDAIASALRQARGNAAAAARALGLTRQSLHRKIRRLRIRT